VTLLAVGSSSSSRPGPWRPGLAQASEPGKPAYVEGVFPYLSVPTLESVFAPIAAQLAGPLHRQVRFTTTSSYEDFARRLGGAEYDIAYVQPFDYVRVAVPAGYLPVATGYEPICIAFYVPERSAIREAGDLRGKTVGLPPRLSAASLLAEVALKGIHLAPGEDVQLRYFSSHQSCLQQVSIGNVDACVSASDIVRMFEGLMNVRFRSVLKSPTIPGSVFVVHQRIGEAERELVRNTLIASALEGVPPHLKRLFKEGDLEHRGRYFRPVNDADYDVVRSYLKMLRAEP
jgi:phosphonate transport system substrate-binding protein